ncbi:MAG: nuclear transport factor 2 family protein [Chloroflexota bacterium]
MYQQIAKHQIRQGYANISRGNFDVLLKQFSPHVKFCFSGDHAMGGELRNRESVRQWFERVHRLFPGLQIQADRIFVSGLPWDMTVTVEFTVCDTLPDGKRYQNQGIQVVRIQWGQVIEDYLIEDTQVLVGILHHLAELGVAEATAAPIQ